MGMDECRSRIRPFFFSFLPKLFGRRAVTKSALHLHQRESCPSKPPESHVEDRGCCGLTSEPLAIAGPAMGCHTSPLSSKSQVLLVGVRSRALERGMACELCV